MPSALLSRKVPSDLPDDTARVTRVIARAYRIPTLSPEADGTIAWDSTTLVTAYVDAGGKQGFGYSYAGRGAIAVIEDTLATAITGLSAFNIPQCWQAMCVAVRNLGRSGEAACAISAVDAALWDLKGKLLGMPLAALLGKARSRVPVYGSGGFTTYGPKEIARQIEGWAKAGIWQYKIKIGLGDEQDGSRISAAVKALPKGNLLLVDANGAYYPKQALAMAEALAEMDVAWFEEPVSSDDIHGLRFMREHAPSCMDIAAGEYSYNADDCRRLLENEAVDALQIDATRCLGITGFLKGAALAEAYHRPVSSHCAPALHAALMCHVQDALHIEYFSDHARIEQMLFDGVPELRKGYLPATNNAPGLGILFKEQDAEKFAL